LNDYDEQPPAALRSPSGQRHHPASVGDPIGLVEPLPGRTGPGWAAEPSPSSCCVCTPGHDPPMPTRLTAEGDRVDNQARAPRPTPTTAASGTGRALDDPINQFS